MAIRERAESSPVHREPLDGFFLSEVEVRLAAPEGRPLRGTLMDRLHFLRFRRLAGRGFRYVPTV